MKREFNFGKIDFCNKGSKENKVTISIEYVENKKGQKVFKASGCVWNKHKTDAVICGQCLNDIAEYIDDPIFLEIFRLWKNYHLNDMYPECEHQNKLRWRGKGDRKIKLYHWTINHDAIRQKNNAERTALEASKEGKTFTPTKEQVFFANLKYEIVTDKETLSEKLYPLYKKAKDGHIEEKYAFEVKESEHPEGILSKPCPICGYKYGSAWNYFPIPEKDEKIILHLLEYGKIKEA